MARPRRPSNVLTEEVTVAGPTASSSSSSSAASVPSADEIEGAGAACPRSEDGDHVLEIRDGRERCSLCGEAFGDDAGQIKAAADAAGAAALEELEEAKAVEADPPPPAKRREWIVDLTVVWTPPGSPHATTIPAGSRVSLSQSELEALLAATPTLPIRPVHLEDEERRDIMAEANRMIQAGQPLPAKLAQLVQLAVAGRSS